MTVKELIEELKKFPDDMVVKICDDYDYQPVFALEEYNQEYNNEKPCIIIRY